MPDETSIPLLPVMFMNFNRNMMEPWYNYDAAQLHLVDVMGNGRCGASSSWIHLMEQSRAGFSSK